MKTHEEKVKAFRTALKQLILEHDFTVAVDTGYYGDVDGIDFCIGRQRVAHCEPRIWFASPHWDLDDTGHKSVEQLRKENF